MKHIKAARLSVSVLSNMGEPEEEQMLHPKVEAYRCCPLNICIVKILQNYDDVWPVEELRHAFNKNSIHRYQRFIICLHPANKVGLTRHKTRDMGHSRLTFDPLLLSSD